MEKIFYRVDKNDTLLTLSNRYKVSPFSIIKDNMLTKEIEEGDLIVIKKEKAVKISPFYSEEKIFELTKKSKQELLLLNGIPYFLLNTYIRIE